LPTEHTEDTEGTRQARDTGNRDYFRVFRVFRGNFSFMKSAYELAMERLSKSDPAQGKPLTPAQKARLAELDKIYQGKWAEREIFLKKQLDEAYTAQKAEEVTKIQKQLAHERARIDEERDEEKERVRREK